MNAADIADDVVQVLEGACDELLIRGRGRDYGTIWGDDPICLIHALGSASRRLFITAQPGSGLRSITASQAAARLLERHTGADNIVTFNNNATDDEAFDALRDTAKLLRNGELEVA